MRLAAAALLQPEPICPFHNSPSSSHPSMRLGRREESERGNKIASRVPTSSSLQIMCGDCFFKSVLPGYCTERNARLSSNSNQTQTNLPPVNWKSAVQTKCIEFYRCNLNLNWNKVEDLLLYNVIIPLCVTYMLRQCIGITAWMWLLVVQGLLSKYFYFSKSRLFMFLGFTLLSFLLYSSYRIISCFSHNRMGK